MKMSPRLLRDLARELRPLALRLAALSAASRTGVATAPHPSERRDWLGANVVHIGGSR